MPRYKEKGLIKPETLQSSFFYGKIRLRLETLSELEDILDGEFLIYEYDQRKNHFSNIRADYVIKAFTRNGKAFFFLAREEHSEGDAYGCSIFAGGEIDYSINQTRTTVLSVVKKFRRD